MRYYDISLIKQGSSQPFRRWSSNYNGKFDPGALDVEFDMPVAPYGTPLGGQAITIYGVPLADLSQAYNFEGTDIVVNGGMQAGLPLANPKQAGMLLRGQVFQGFGTWQGTDMRLDLIVYPSQYTSDNPGNFVLNWLAGRPLAEALKTTLSIVYPGVPVDINVGSNLVFDSDEHHFCATLEELSQHVGDLTQQAFRQRVEIAFQAGKIIIFDSTYKAKPVQLNFTDLIGQPVWLKRNIVQIKTVMRADLEIGSALKMPTGYLNAPGFAQTSLSAALSDGGGALPSTGRAAAIFQGDFKVNEIRHIGRFRSSSGEDWATIINCVTGD